MNKVIVFCLGATAGSLLTWKLIEKKYKDLADEEIQSVIDTFNERKEIEKNIEKVETFTEKIENPTVEVVKASPKAIENYTKYTEKLGYNLDISKEDGVIVSEDKDGSIYVEPGVDYVAPYVISPDEFGETQYYDAKSWTLYTDSIITNEVGEIVDDPETYIGDALNHFGEYEDDSVHVRNENVECDYEIIKVDVSFEEINRRSLDDSSARS